MKLVESKGGRFVFQIGKRERRVLDELFGLYPLIPIAYHTVNRGGRTPRLVESQKLLEEALAERRQEHKRAIETFWKGLEPSEEAGGSFRFSLDGAEVEWLLEVLNDVRIGSWLKLGSPDAKSLSRIELTDQSAPYMWSMEACGYFEMRLLEALESAN